MPTRESFYTDEQQAIIRATIKWYMAVRSVGTEWLASEMGLRVQTVRNYLGGSCRITRNTCDRFAAALGCTPESLYTGDMYKPEVITEINERLKRLEEAVFGSVDGNK